MLTNLKISLFSAATVMPETTNPNPIFCPSFTVVVAAAIVVIVWVRIYNALKVVKD